MKSCFSLRLPLRGKTVCSNDQSWIQQTDSAPQDIVIKGFRDLRHFLAWFQIDMQSPMIFPANQGRTIKQHGDCITICGFHDLDEFLCWVSKGAYHPVGHMKNNAPCATSTQTAPLP
ncbi:hypothetical protein V8J88_16200 [Massilia sp. W12]|uniref:hypothetical protein n=1 Tax=Massilia sp. W12 TaxID=3126507 RepID=UPI0030D06DAC